MTTYIWSHSALVLLCVGFVAGCEGQVNSDAANQRAATETRVVQTSQAMGTLDNETLSVEATLPAGGNAVWSVASLPGLRLFAPAGALGRDVDVKIQYAKSADGERLDISAVPGDPPLAPLELTLPRSMSQKVPRAGLTTTYSRVLFDDAEVSYDVTSDDLVAIKLVRWGTVAVKVAVVSPQPGPAVVEPAPGPAPAPAPGPAPSPAPLASLPPKPASLAFDDADLDAGQISGTVTIGAAANEADVTAYVLKWGTAAAVSFDGAAIATIAKGAALTHVFPADTAIPANVTHLHVVSVGPGGESDLRVLELGDAIRAQAGFAARNGFRFKAAFGNTPGCAAGNVNLSATPRSDGWYQFQGLLSDHTYEVVCRDGVKRASFRYRTLGAVSETIISGAAFVQGGKTYGMGSCFADARSLAFNPVTGTLDVAGQNRGDATNPPNHCFASYDGTSWKVLRLPYPGEVNGVVVDYNVGYGLTYLADGTTVTRDTVLVGATHYNRLNFCAADCTKAASWSSLVLDGAFGTMNPCQANITATPDRTKLLLFNGCGTAHYTECTVANDCKQLASWSALTEVSPSMGSEAHTDPLFTADGGLWLTGSSIDNALMHCPAGADCKLAGSWRRGKLPSQTYQFQRSILMLQEGTVIRFVAGEDSGTTWFVAECDTAVKACGTPTAGVYTNFTTTVLNGMPQGRLHTFRKLANGYHHTFLDQSDGDKTKHWRCIGDFATCFASSAGWGTPGLIADDSPSVWGLYLERRGFVDGLGAPLGWPNGTAGLVYFSSP